MPPDNELEYLDSLIGIVDPNGAHGLRTAMEGLKQVQRETDELSKLLDEIEEMERRAKLPTFWDHILEE